MNQFLLSKVNKSYISSYFSYNIFSYFYSLNCNNAVALYSWFNFLVGDVVVVKFIDISSEELRIKFFVGICILIKNKFIFTSFCLRNIIKKEGLENRFFLFSPIILNISILKKYRKKYRLAKLYFFRNKIKKFY